MEFALSIVGTRFQACLSSTSATRRVSFQIGEFWVGQFSLVIFSDRKEEMHLWVDIAHQQTLYMIRFGIATCDWDRDWPMRFVSFFFFFFYSFRAMDTIAKFPLVTIEKGQGFNDTNCSQYGPGVNFPCAEEKIVEQCTIAWFVSGPSSQYIFIFDLLKLSE